MRDCVVPGCERPHSAWGYCTAHYNRVRRHGHPKADVPIRAARRDDLEEDETEMTVAHPVAAARVAAGLPPRTRVERLLALADLAEAGPSPEEYELERARILEGVGL